MVDTLVNRVEKLAQIQPDKLAVIFKKEHLTYKQLYYKMREIAGVLESHGIEAGDKVSFTATSKPETVAVYLAIQLCGAVAVFLDKNSTTENMATIYRESESKLMLTDKPMREYAEQCNVMSLHGIYGEAAELKVIEQQHKRDANDLAEILFTTGTTGTPKGVMLTYKSVYNIFMNTIDGIGIEQSDIMLLPLPLNHSYGLRVLRAILYQGATAVLQNGFTFAKEVENNIMTYRCNALACVPASFEVMKSQMQDSFASILGNMRFIEFGAGSLSVKQRKEITSLLPKVTIYNTWGSSETGGAIFCNVTEVVSSETEIGSLGRPLDGKVEVKVLDADGNSIESNEDNPGRMAIKGDMQMAGYWNNIVATEQTLVDGWLLTNDMVYIRNGHVFMLGRADDIINVGGEKVSPIEVENLAGQYEGIKECACIGVEDPNEILGQVPVLFVVAKNGYSEEELAKFISARAEKYKMPQYFYQIETIPRNRMQKVDRNELRNIWNNRDSIDLLNPVMQTILSRHSIRKFMDKDIPQPILDMILRAGYHAPSGHNMQSWRFTVLTITEDIARLKELTRIASEDKKIHFYGFENPKVLILISNDERNANGCQDASCAAENIMLAAWSYGVGSVWLNPFKSLRHVEPVESLFDSYEIPNNHVIWTAIALGYPFSDGAVLKKKTDVIRYI